MAQPGLTHYDLAYPTFGPATADGLLAEMRPSAAITHEVQFVTYNYYTDTGKLFQIIGSVYLEIRGPSHTKCSNVPSA